MNSHPGVTHVFYGQDESSLKQAVAEFIRQHSDPGTEALNVTRMDGRITSAGEIDASARALPFLTDVRVVIVDNLTEGAGGRAALERLPDLLAGLPDSTRLIFVETALGEGDSDSGGSRAAGRKQALKKLINVVETDPRGKVHAYDMPDDLVGWLRTRAKEYGAVLEISAARRLAERLGGDLILADSELAKLATYAGQSAITEEAVNLLTPYSAEANIFHMVDALGQRNGQAALKALRQLLDDGNEPLRVFGMITRQYRLLIQMSEQIGRGQPVSGAAQALKLRDFVARKLAEQARNYRMEQLERILEHLLEVDKAIKTGQVDGQLALEQLIVRLAGRG